MVEFSVEVNDSSFREWANRTIENVKLMVYVLKEIKAIYYNIIGPLTPLDQGYLQHSFMEYSNVYSEYPLFELRMEMSGRDNPDANGFDYAEIQFTENYNHPIQGIQYYMKEGFDEAEPLVLQRLATDYLSALGGH